MTIQLANPPGYTFVPLLALDGCPELVAHLDQTALYAVALVMGAAPTPTQLQAMLQAGEVQLWRIEATDGPNRACFAVLSHYAQAHDASVFCPGGFDEAATVAGLEALTRAIFAQMGSCDYIWTALPTPLARGAEQALLLLGFNFTPSFNDGRVSKRTYELSRQVFAAYHPELGAASQQ